MVRFQAYSGFGTVPADSCKFAVVDNETGIEVCRVWSERYARMIAALLEAEHSSDIETLETVDD